MKIQDILLTCLLLFLSYKHNPRYFAIAGLSLLAFSIPFFAFWIFFTAQRLVWYGVAFLLLSILLHIYYARNRE